MHTTSRPTSKLIELGLHYVRNQHLPSTVKIRLSECGGFPEIDPDTRGSKNQRYGRGRMNCHFLSLERLSQKPSICIPRHFTGDLRIEKVQHSTTSAPTEQASLPPYRSRPCSRPTSLHRPPLRIGVSVRVRTPSLLYHGHQSFTLSTLGEGCSDLGNT